MTTYYMRVDTTIKGLLNICS